MIKKMANASAEDKRIDTLNFGEDLIEHLADVLNADGAARDLSRTAVIFGGKRPALFVKRALARRIATGFYPPRFFSIDEWIAFLVRKTAPFQPANDLDQCYLFYQMAQKHCPQILKGRETFAQFLPWTRELLAFIDQLDLEGVSDEKLRNIEANAQIGYAVPSDINLLLESIVVLRAAVHEQMMAARVLSRGLRYRTAAQAAAAVGLEEFDEIIFCNFFYFNHCEGQVAKALYDRGLARFIFQGDEDRWATLKRTARLLGGPIKERNPAPPDFQLRLYRAFDGHSQVAMAREILRTVERPEKTVVVLPDPDLIIPLIAEVQPLVKDFNISMGYPLTRSSVYCLLDFIFKAQLSVSEHGYYSRDYLRVLRHPLMKNLDLGLGATAVRVLIHKVEEVLTGVLPTAVSGNIVISLTELLAVETLFAQVQETLGGMGTDVSVEQLQETLRHVHDIAFGQWEHFGTLSEFSRCLDAFLTTMLGKSPLRNYPLNLKICEKILSVQEEIAAVSFHKERFPKEDIFKIFEAKMRREIVAFSGSPLKGLQILGLFETRALNFDTVIVLDTNEGVLPRLNVTEPLIPREVMVTLGLDRLEQEEEIQRYQFMRLVCAAKSVHLIYAQNSQKERSRFVEELVWEAEKRAQKFDVVPLVQPGFQVRISDRRAVVAKTPQMIALLKGLRYSASSINTYVRSPVEFYYNYVLGLRERDNVLEEPENRQVGEFVHALLETAFKNFVGRKPVVDGPFKLYFQKALDEKFSQSFGKGQRSDAFLLKTVLDARLKRFLEAEADENRRPVAEVLFIEKKFQDQIALSAGTVSLSYRVDRVDRMRDGTIMILDYKTGAVDPMPKAIDEIEAMELSRENIRDVIKSFQIPLYYYYLSRAYPDQPVNAAYYNLRTLKVNKFVDDKMPFERQRIIEAFLRPLDFIIKEILNPAVPFAD